MSISFISYGLPSHNPLFLMGRSFNDYSQGTGEVLSIQTFMFKPSHSSFAQLLRSDLVCAPALVIQFPQSPRSHSHHLLHLLWPPFPYTLTLVRRLFSRHSRSTQHSKFKRSHSSFAQSLRFDLVRASRIINSLPLFLVTPAASRPPYFTTITFQLCTVAPV